MTLRTFIRWYASSVFWGGLCFLCLPWLLQPQLLPLDRQWFPNISAKCALTYDDSVPRHENRGWELKWIPWITRLPIRANLQWGTYAGIWTWRFRTNRFGWRGRYWCRTWSRHSWVRLGVRWTLHLLLLAVLACVPSIWAKCVQSYDDSILRHENRGWELKWIPWITRLPIWANLQWRIAASIWIWLFRTRRKYWCRTWSRNSWVRSGMWRNLHLLLLAVL